MKIIVGLGNPGAQYEATRHNVGFLAVDWLVDVWKARGPDLREQGEVFSATVRSEKVLLVKPQTYMNQSGRTVGPLFKFYKCAPEDLIVIHDDLDLKPLTLRLKTGGGTGGHNGLKSIDAHVGAQATGYHRARLGIGKPGPLDPPMDTADYVLGQFRDDEWKGLEDLFSKTEKALYLVLDGKMSEAMNQFNGGAGK
jgi:PTH1 family peptidyl-tRNA hydrolase